MDPEILVSSRVGNGFGDFDIPGDNVIPDDTKDSCWECIATSNNSWGYNQYDDDWKSPQEMLFWLISTVSKGGNLLMNVGPTGEGVIPEPVVENLYKVGEWLKVNGEAIYGAEPWSVHHEGPTGVEIKGTLDRKNFGFIDRFTSEDFWFTQKNGRIYVMALVYPENGIAMVRSLKNVSITSARLLGGAADVTFEITNDGVQFKLPKDVSFPNGYVLEVF
jgi:alpha-L-fucosidase